MKVIAVMEVSPNDGGGFYQALNAVKQMQRLCAGRYRFEVGVIHPGTLAVLASLGIEAFALPTNVFERLRFWLHSLRPRRGGDAGGGSGHGRATRWRRWIVDALRAIPDPARLERRLRARQADLVYFVAPWGRRHRLDHLVFWVTIWDLAHVEYVEFPELAGAARRREAILQEALLRSAVVVADSPELKSLVCHRYGVVADRVVAMPFLPAAHLAAEAPASSAERPDSPGLAPGYLFYPAQFWAHKNHVRILEALKLCADRGRVLEVVFAGGDKGGRAHVESAAAALGVEGQVRFLGFVDARVMRGLYEACSAVVMPTYFGPTNLPPLEAWSLGVPLIYSRHLSGQAGDAALLVDPDDAAELASAILSVTEPGLRAELVARGHRRLEVLDLAREAAETWLADSLRRLQSRLACSRPLHG